MDVYSLRFIHGFYLAADLVPRHILLLIGRPVDFRCDMLPQRILVLIHVYRFCQCILFGTLTDTCIVSTFDVDICDNSLHSPDAAHRTPAVAGLTYIDEQCQHQYQEK